MSILKTDRSGASDTCWHWLTLLILLAWPGILSAQEPVRIALLPEIVVDSDVVTLGEVASIEGGDSGKRAAMSRLDLAVDSGASASAIDRNEAIARLLIAGFDSAEFRFAGPAQVRVLSAGAPLNNELLAEAISRHVSEGLNIPQQDVMVDLLSVPDAFVRSDVADLRITPLDHSDRLVGRRSVTLGIFDGSRMIEQIRVNARTTFHREVLVSSRPIERGETLNADNSFLERRRFESAAKGQWLGVDAWGSKTSHRIRAQQTLRVSNLARGGLADSDILVRPRDLVTVVAAKGQLKVTMSGLQAMKSGKAGDVIPLRNPASKKIIYGRIIDANRIEVAF